MTIDIDNFKKINDTYGHDIGDQALQHLSKVVGQVIRDKIYLAASAAKNS